MKSMATNGIVLWLPALLLLATSALPLAATPAGTPAQLPAGPAALHQNTVQASAAPAASDRKALRAAEQAPVVARHALPLQAYRDALEDTESKLEKPDGAREHAVVAAKTGAFALAGHTTSGGDVQLAADTQAAASPAGIRKAAQAPPEADLVARAARPAADTQAAASLSGSQEATQAPAEADVADQEARPAANTRATASPANVQEASQTSGQARSSGSSLRLTEEPRAAASPASLERPAQALAKTDRESHPSRLAEDTQVAASPANIEEAAQTSAGEDGDSRSAVAEAPGNIQSPDASQRVAQTALESMMYQSIGRRRTEAGLDPLQLDQKLTALARQRSQDMAQKDYFSHTGPDGTTARSLMIAAGIGPGLMGEILGRNNSADLGESVSSVVDAFMASSSHRGSIVQPRFRAAGVGTAVGRDGMKYYTILFFGT